MIREKTKIAIAVNKWGNSIPPHLKCVATLPRETSEMYYFCVYPTGLYEKYRRWLMSGHTIMLKLLIQNCYKFCTIWIFVSVLLEPENVY